MGGVLVGSLRQPFLFVFAYVLPNVGLTVGGAARAGEFSTLLVAGVVGLSMFMQGLQAVTIQFAIEFGYTREIEDRVMAPLPVWAVAVEKVAAGALQALAAGAVVFPIAAVVPATAVHLHPNVPALFALGLLAALLSSVVGLVVGVPHMNLWLVAAAMSGFVLVLGAVGIRGFPPPRDRVRER